MRIEVNKLNGSFFITHDGNKLNAGSERACIMYLTWMFTTEIRQDDIEDIRPTKHYQMVFENDLTYPVEPDKTSIGRNITTYEKWRYWASISYDFADVLMIVANSYRDYHDRDRIAMPCEAE